MTEKNKRPNSNHLFGPRPLRSWRLWGLIILTIYSLIGFFAIPYVIKSQITTLTPELTGREISISEVKLNPFTLSLTIHGLSLADKDNIELAGLDEFYVNFETFLSNKDRLTTAVLYLIGSI